MRLRWLAGLAICAMFAMPARAADQPYKGLLVTPAREYATVTPGTSVQKQLTLANYTDKPLTVDLSVEQFNVASYSYDFTFEPPADHWVTISVPQVVLQPTKSQTVTYTLAAPADATPGGHYFTVLATATMQNGAVQSRVQAASVLYTTVQGAVKVSSEIEKGTIPRVSFGGDIPFTLDVKNTGNTHFFVYASGELGGKKGAQATHLLMPDTVRTIGGVIPAPLLPGIYAAHYGYTAEDGTPIVWQSHIIYIPVWSWFVVTGAVWLIAVLFRRRHRRKKLTDFEQRPYKS